ncbi:MAG TPA: 23S rRNA (adenine(2503)-C(2))-methyltransferase RlmN [Chitinophagaceae bacterium]|nr:MAG: radical SAM protein [Bacteroidetes bacterium OLB11]HMN32232.1 23S rRNA (adenine(2503)-C(2))-methyltransferase RlmN [Chitinophagaceae bacterium]
MKNLRHLSFEEIEKLILSYGEKPYRAKQIYEWIWKHGARSIYEMSNISKSIKDKLNAEYTLNALQNHHTQLSNDSTIKNRFVLSDGNFIEGVLIPTATRMTACVSSQVGCSLACQFCATGFMERKRNVDFDEIYDQVFLLNRQAIEHYGTKLSNIVYMGMGEPLLNYSNVMKSIEKITSTDGLGMSPSRITVSTAGVTKMIKRLADDQVKFNLAISLHAPTDAKRNQIMPINETNHISSLIESLDYYYKKLKKHVTFEYILFDQFNDSIEDADELIKIARRIPSKINLIEYNPVSGVKLKKSSEQNMLKFMNHLEKNRVNARLRRSRGKDIDAACGQLANINHPSLQQP